MSFNQRAWVVESHGDRSVLRYQVAAQLSGVPQWASNYPMASELGVDAQEEPVLYTLTLGHPPAG